MASAEVQLVPLGTLAPGFAQGLAQRISRRIRATCRVRPPLQLEELPTVAGRDQADADVLLALLDALTGADTMLVGLTAADIAIPVFTFVFGRARRGGRSCLVSLARLDPVFYGLPSDSQRLADRTVAEVLHELGHVAGLAHCRDFACLMHFAAAVEAIDVRGTAFCGPCAGLLPGWLRPEGEVLGPAGTLVAPSGGREDP